MKMCMQGFNELFTVPMLLIYLNNLTNFAAIPEYLACKNCNFNDKISERLFMAFYAFTTILIWTIASLIHSSVTRHLKIIVYMIY